MDAPSHGKISRYRHGAVALILGLGIGCAGGAGTQTSSPTADASSGTDGPAAPTTADAGSQPEHSTGDGAGGTIGSGMDLAPAGDNSDVGSDTTATPAGRDAGTTATGPLVFVPNELVFSGVRGTKLPDKTLTVRNTAGTAIDLTALALMGADKALFSLAAPGLPVKLAPAAATTLRLTFTPPVDAALGLHTASLTVTSSNTAANTEVSLYALATKGEQGNNEPPLQVVLETLGYKIDVGGAGLILGITDNLLGTEVRAQRFVRASPTAVTMKPVARYSPDEPLPYGYYMGTGTPKRVVVGVIDRGNEQTLLPAVQPGAKDGFDPADASFGFYSESKTRTTYTEDALNAANPTKHAVRVYPLRDRGGAPVANAYLLAYEEAANGDFNDYVYVVTNVNAAP